MTEELDKNYWENRYKSSATGWDIGKVSPPLKDYFDSLKDKSLKILIPGCGRGYEAAYLHDLGFKHVYPLDISEEVRAEFFKLHPHFPAENWISEDFFQVKGRYDLIVEQTFFCAIDPSLRSKYIAKCHELLRPGGKLIGLLFDDNIEGGPPFGGSKEEYIRQFSPVFQKFSIKKAVNSIKPRAGREVFIIAEK